MYSIQISILIQRSINIWATHADTDIVTDRHADIDIDTGTSAHIDIDTDVVLDIYKDIEMDVELEIETDIDIDIDVDMHTELVLFLFWADRPVSHNYALSSSCCRV